MKKIALVLLFAFGTTLSIQAQEFNTIPTSQEFKLLADGWYKFSLEGTSFDVEIKAGKFVKGNIKWFDGATYSGTLAGTELSGKGTYVWKDGSKYEGSFKKHMRHGKGSLTKADGTKWSGKWKENLKNGKGKIFDANGNVLEEGTWASNELVANKK
ncbi:hypothetical protein [uncultured Croceitalea sp.]|uniref:hypothetical protein n=1 Tax=uncultured Croceitalea sp. TaxID=1798908 RepID=UPI00374ED81F